MWSMSSPEVTFYRLSIVTISHCFRSAPTCHGQTHGRTDGKRRQFIGRQTLELCTEIGHLFIQTSTATVHRSKERAMIGLCWSQFFYFPFNANVSIAAAVAGYSDDSDVVAGEASYVSSSSLLLLLLLLL